MDRTGILSRAEQVLDAALPGWRDGRIQFGLRAASGHVIAPMATPELAERAAYTGDRLVKRWVSDWQEVPE